MTQPPDPATGEPTPAEEPSPTVPDAQSPAGTPASASAPAEPTEARPLPTFPLPGETLPAPPPSAAAAPPPTAAPPPAAATAPPPPAGGTAPLGGGIAPLAPAAAGYGYGQVASVPQGMWYDAESGLTLPEGVVLASVGRRIGAFFLTFPLAIVTLFIGYAIWGLIVWGKGTTPALQVLGMRCWRPETGKPANWGWMALREVLGRIAEDFFSLITELLSFILMVATKDRRSLHDLIGGTVVVHDPNKVLDTWGR